MIYVRGVGVGGVIAMLKSTLIVFTMKYALSFFLSFTNFSTQLINISSKVTNTL
jgi:hypothetical protein